MDRELTGLYLTIILVLTLTLILIRIPIRIRKLVLVLKLRTILMLANKHEIGFRVQQHRRSWTDTRALPC